MREDRKEQTVEGSRRQRASRRRGGKRLAPAPPSRHQLPLYLLPAALAFLAVALLTAQITLYCDDFMYATFFREGLGGFWELTK